MKLLRETIRRIILEGAVKDSFDELWYNTEEARETYDMMQGGEGTYHKGNLAKLSKSYLNPYTDKFIDQFFKDKRDLKRLWNETIDANGLRSFWEGPKMKYFHSLAYYTPGGGTEESLGYSLSDDNSLGDLHVESFLQKYKMRGNKDEMSTWGIYLPDPNLRFEENKAIGLLLRGRVTLATAQDAWTESRSKATPKDLETHRSSGMPKRIMPTEENIEALVFEEIDIQDFGGIGECVLDNWGIEAIVYHPNLVSWKHNKESLEALAEEYNLPLLDARDIWGI